MNMFIQKYFFYSFLLFSAILGATAPMQATSKIRASLTSLVRKLVRPAYAASMSQTGSDFRFFEKKDGGYRLWSRKKWTFTLTEESSGFDIPGKSPVKIQPAQHNDGDDNNVFYHRGTEKAGNIEAGVGHVVDADCVVDGQEYKAPQSEKAGFLSKIFALLPGKKQ